ncbi:uncharacterized protein LOC6576517 isoform X1 [Drosophila mojavensis]|uniref:Uncharacterized protein, isoform A n=1 Tax=Drosophila mojavensis TaxID=7230 RepID=B4KEX9_DROMO|nr:uncharacterized protein LOC6576517 isoform X1 [Drosophila mojavensis]XP_015020691.1 uncharacterized protein LOC6576517 isoform X1 [Drosophila mojavensis]EDW11948.1 uncharacterized protein Dmoj_GI17420, isoform A [Drosophila mojavensis]KRG02984.1 uncharacterized protein Dmoj_GI17420, isoform E [Drosophila mojavensis]
MDRREADVYGGQPNLNLSHEVRIYLLSAMFALAALIQWILIGYFSDWRKYKMPQERYGFWLMATFFGICLLSCTPCGRRCPWNVMLVIIIVESSTLYIAVEQQNSRGFMVNIYAVTIVFLVVITSIFYGAYFPMRMVPGDLMLSLGVAIANIMMILFFLNAFIIKNDTIFTIVRNYFAFTAITMIMYTATIIHDRQSDVPKHEYIYLSVLLFFGQMILHERILAISASTTRSQACESTKAI